LAKLKIDKTFRYNIVSLNIQCGVFMTQPTQVPNVSDPKYGFNRYAEQLNGRAAMVGLIAAVLIEVLTGQGVLSWLGLR
jgi:hypothetical protein